MSDAAEFKGLSALYVNCTLTVSPGSRHTQLTDLAGR